LIESDLSFDNKSDYSLLFGFFWIVNQNDKISPYVLPRFHCTKWQGFALL